MANPKTKIDWDKLNAMLQFGPTLRLCAEELGTTEKTLQRHIKREHNMTFEDYKDSKMDKTRLRLQEKAIMMASNGNATMMIFCLKNLCKWSDNQQIVGSNVPVKFVIEKSDKEKSGKN